jgi:hypothetical protein
MNYMLELFFSESLTFTAIWEMVLLEVRRNLELFRIEFC